MEVGSQAAVSADPDPVPPRAASTGTTDRPASNRRAQRYWLIVAALVILAAVLFIILTKTWPSYDAFGWLVWGKQTLHGSLNTDGAPSWKPVTFLFTLPYALAGHAQLWLWVLTAIAVAFAGAVFAGRIAYRLTGPCPERPYAPMVAAAVAGIGVLGLNGYLHLLLIASSDPMMLTFCLAAIDAHLSGRPRLAFVMLVLTGLGRPEAWAFAGLYALWAWRSVPAMRAIVVVGIALIPALWFSVPALTSKSWFISGDLALHSVNVIHGNKVLGVLGRFIHLWALPMELAALLAVVLAVRRRDRTTLMLAGAAVLWIVIEIAFAYHGWSAVPRYLMEPAGVMLALAGSGVGRLIAYAPPGHRLVRWVGPLVAAVLLIAMLPYASDAEPLARAQVSKQRLNGKQLDRLEAVIRRDGGAARIRACGQPVTLLGMQSAVAWELGMNVGDVGYKPGRAISAGAPIVVFKPHLLGWQVRPIHIRAADVERCGSLDTDSAFG